MLIYIIIATLLVGAFSLTGILLIFKNKEGKINLKPLVSLAAGALLAVAFLDLIPEAIEESAGVFEPHFISAMILLSILAFFILERILHWHHCSDDLHPHNHDHAHKNQGIIYLNLVGDGLHNLIDGFLIAGAFLLDFQAGVLVTIGVILHEIPQEIFDFSILLHAGLSRAKAILYNILISLTAVAGAVIFYYFGEGFEIIIPIIAAIAAGNFIYLSVADLIPELHHEQKRNKIVAHTLWLLLGVAIIYSINTILPHSS